MSIDDKMTIDERRTYLMKMQERSVQAGRREPGQWLEEMESLTGLHRKSLIRIVCDSLLVNPVGISEVTTEWILVPERRDQVSRRRRGPIRSRQVLCQPPPFKQRQETEVCTVAEREKKL